jgi:hypothetical protein
VRDYNLRKIYEGTAGDEKTYVGNLTIGKYKLVKDKEIKECDYESNKNNKKIISSATKNNIEKLKEAFKSDITIDKIYRAVIATTRSVYSTYISGTLKGESFIWARIETNSAGAGQTKLYFEDGFTNAVKFISYVFTPTTLEKTSEGTYRIHNRVERIITYSTEYEEEQIGPKRFDIVNYGPSGDYHRISLPARLSYAPTSYNAQFYENGWIRFTIYSYLGMHMTISFPDPDWGYIAKDDGSDYSFDKMFREDLSK